MDPALLDRAHALATEWLDEVDTRPVGVPADADALRAALGGPLPDGPGDPLATIERLGAAAPAGLVATPGPRYFGFVNGGTLDVALAADWLVSAWDQNAAMHVMSPTAAVVEEVVLGWLTDVLGLPGGLSGAFVTGGQMANVVGLLAARHQVLAQAGWDVEEDGLVGAPPVTVVVGGERHASVDLALRYIGLGRRSTVALPVDANGAMEPSGLADVLAAHPGPAIVVAQAGNVNTGAFDPFEAICDQAHEAAAWVHVDGAFGLWACASPRLADQVAGVGRADSWAVDMHKWLNCPYDCSVALTAHPDAHRAALSVAAAYLPPSDHREPIEWNPEMSRRARAVPVWAALATLGREGAADLVDRCCAAARRFADGLAAVDGAEVLNDVVLNQVLVRFDDDDATTAAVIAALQADGTAWMGGTTWQGRTAMRISVSNWKTTPTHVDQTLTALTRCLTQARTKQ